MRRMVHETDCLRLGSLPKSVLPHACRKTNSLAINQARQMPIIEIETLRSLVDYHSSGSLIWKARESPCTESKRFNTRYAGKHVRGEIDRYGYRVVQIDKVRVKYHRAVFAFHHGYWPETVDHVNRNPLDNRIENLRAATRAQQQWNVLRTKKAKSGYVGVEQKGCRWRAVTKINGRKIYLGSFATPEEARDAYLRKIAERNWAST